MNRQIDLSSDAALAIQRSVAPRSKTSSRNAKARPILARFAVALITLIVMVSISGIGAVSSPDTQTTCVQPPSGLLSWWPGDGNAFDLVSDNDGTLKNGATFAEGKVGQAFSLDGADDYVYVPPTSNIKGGPQATYDAWVYPRALPNIGNYVAIAAVGDPTQPLWSPQQGRLLYMDSGGPRFYMDCGINDDNNYVSRLSSQTYPPNAWYHVAGVFHDGTIDLYIDGVLDNGIGTVSSGAFINTLAATYVTMGVLASPDLSLTYARFNGLIDEFEIFNRALSASEIAAIVNAGSAGKCRTCEAPPSGMRAWWPGDGNANDIQNGNNGTAQNGATFGPGKVGQAFVLNGTNQWFETPDADSLHIPQGITLDAWVKTSDPNSSQNIIFKPLNAYNWSSYAVYVAAGGSLVFEIDKWSVGRYGVWTTNVGMSANVWHHVAATWQNLHGDGTDATLYIDGIPQTTSFNSQGYNSEMTLEYAQYPLYIGRDYNGNYFFNGSIDEVEIFDRVLTVDEIEDIVNAGSAGKCKCTLTCPQDQTASTGPNATGCGTVVNYTAPSVTGPCAAVCDPPSGSTFPVGTTTVACSTTDGSGNQYSCNFRVSVTDTTPPSIAGPANVVKSTDANQCTAVVTYANATAADNCSGVGTPSCVPASGATFPKGVTTVSCSVGDAAGNTATCSFTVTVNDTQPPGISCSANVVVSAALNRCDAVVNYAEPSVVDNCPRVGTPLCSPASGSTFPKGTTTVTCSVSDAANNQSSCSFTVTVNDTQLPTITCPANIIAVTPRGASCASVSFAATASDNCPGLAVTYKLNGATITSPHCFAPGTNTVIATATDTTGNTATCSFTVTVFDVVMKDDVNGNLLRLVSTTGQFDYFSCRKNWSMSGRATVKITGCKLEVWYYGEDPKRPDCSMYGLANTCTDVGQCSLLMYATGQSYPIKDSRMSDSTFTCP